MRRVNVLLSAFSSSILAYRHDALAPTEDEDLIEMVQRFVPCGEPTRSCREVTMLLQLLAATHDNGFA